MRARGARQRAVGEWTCSGRTPTATRRAVSPCSQGIAVISRNANGAG